MSAVIFVPAPRTTAAPGFARTIRTLQGFLDDEANASKGTHPEIRLTGDRYVTPDGATWWTVYPREATQFSTYALVSWDGKPDPENPAATATGITDWCDNLEDLAAGWE